MYTIKLSWDPISVVGKPFDFAFWQERHKKVENVEYTHWKEPKLLVKILLHYFKHQPTDIDLLFQLLRALCSRFIPDFQVSVSSCRQANQSECRHVHIYPLVFERFSGKHRRQRVRGRVEAVGVLPLRRAVPHQRDVAGAEGQGASVGAHSVLRRQLREGTDQHADQQHPVALPRQPRQRRFGIHQQSEFL